MRSLLPLSKKSNFQTIFVVLITTAILLTGCGGGTTGTGDTERVQLKGQLLSETGTPLEDVRVTLLETGDSVVSNESGNFSLPLPIKGSEFSLLLEKNGAETTASFTDETATSELRVEIVLGSNGTSISVISARVVNESDQQDEIPAGEGDDNVSTTPTPNETPTDNDSMDRSPGTTRLKGKVLYSDGIPAEGVLIRVRGTTDSDTTNRRGEFSVITVTSNTQVRLEVQLNRSKALVDIRNIPSGNSTIELVLKLSIASDSQASDNKPPSTEGGAFSVSIESKRIR